MHMERGLGLESDQGAVKSTSGPVSGLDVVPELCV